MIENNKLRQLHLIENDVNAPKENLLKAFFQIVIGFVAVMAFTMMILLTSANLIIDVLPHEWDRSIQKALRNVDFMSSKPYHQEVAEYIESIVKRLQRHDDQLKEVDFKIIYSDEKLVNAYAVPGDKIIVTRGLYELMDSENELAMVLAHELGHFQMRHHLKAYGRLGVLLFLSAPFAGADLAADLLSEVLQGVGSGYQRKHETEADQFGMNLMIQEYGRQSAGLTAFFKRFIKNESSLKLIRGMSSTHPTNEQRIKLLNEKIETMKLRTGELKSLAVPAQKLKN